MIALKAWNLIHHNIYILANLKPSVICEITEKLYANVQDFFVVFQNSNGYHKNAYIVYVTANPEEVLFNLCQWQETIVSSFFKWDMSEMPTLVA